MPDAMPMMPSADDETPEETEMPAMDMPSMPAEEFVVEGFDGDMYAAF
jgi:hypothetical protein